METKRIIKVTSEHIATGLACSPEYCPVAQAVQEDLKDLGDSDSKVQVTSKYIYIIAVRDGAIQTIEQPAEVSAFINALDSGREVPSFEFELDY